jgi:hypothetical protein
MRCFLIYADDWLSSHAISRMDADEERGYFRLLMRCGSEIDGGLPANERELAKTSLLGIQWFRPTKNEECRFSETETSGQKLLACLVTLDDGQLVNALTREPVQVDPRIDVSQLREGRFYNLRFLREFQYQQEVARKRSSAGRLGVATKRKLREEQTALEVPEIPLAAETVIDVETVESPIPPASNHEEPKTAPAPAENKHLLKNFKQMDKQTYKQKTSNDVWVSVYGFKNQEISDLLSGKREIDLDNPVQTPYPTRDLFLPELLRAASDAGIGFSGEDLRNWIGKRWAAIGFEERQFAVKTLVDSHANGDYDRVRPLLKNYVLEKHYDRRSVTRIDPKRRTASTDNRAAVTALYPKTVVTAEQLAAMQEAS